MAGTALSAFVIGGIISSTYHDVPEYKNWGAHETNEDCVCCLNRPEDIDKTTALNEPISALSSFIFLPATLDSDAAVVFGGVLAAASFVLHSDGSEEARVLDFYSAAAAPAVIAFIGAPPAAGTTLAIVLIVGYETRGSEWIIGGVGAFLAVVATLYVGLDLQHAVGVFFCLVSAGLLRGGKKLEAVCDNDLHLALAHDARHYGWHLSVSILLWLGVGILGKTPRSHPRVAGAITLVPLISLLTDLNGVHMGSWVATTLCATFMMCGLAVYSDTYARV